MGRLTPISIVLATILWATCTNSQQNSSDMDEQTKAQVKQLRSISEAIKACHSEESQDTGNGKFTYRTPFKRHMGCEAESFCSCPVLGLHRVLRAARVFGIRKVL